MLTFLLLDSQGDEVRAVREAARLAREIAAQSVKDSLIACESVLRM